MTFKGRVPIARLKACPPLGEAPLAQEHVRKVEARLPVRRIQGQGRAIALFRLGLALAASQQHPIIRPCHRRCGRTPQRGLTEGFSFDKTFAFEQKNRQIQIRLNASGIKPERLPKRRFGRIRLTRPLPYQSEIDPNLRQFGGLGHNLAKAHFGTDIVASHHLPRALGKKRFDNNGRHGETQAGNGAGVSGECPVLR